MVEWFLSIRCSTTDGSFLFGVVKSELEFLHVAALSFVFWLCFVRFVENNSGNDYKKYDTPREKFT